MTEAVKQNYLTAIAEKIANPPKTDVGKIFALGTLGGMGTGLNWEVLLKKLTQEEADEIRVKLHEAIAAIE